jgi:hypothetical protein
MGDYFPGEIHIGGKVPKALVPALCERISAEGVELEYGGGAFEPKTAEDLLKAADGGTLDLYDAEARYGQFEDIEEFLAKSGIAFDRHSDARYEYDAEEIKFRPGMKDPEVFEGDQEGQVMVSAATLREEVLPLLGKGEAGAAAARILELVGDRIAELEPLAIA